MKGRAGMVEFEWAMSNSRADMRQWANSSEPLNFLASSRSRRRRRGEALRSKA